MGVHPRTHFIAYAWLEARPTGGAFVVSLPGMWHMREIARALNDRSMGALFV